MLEISEELTDARLKTGDRYNESSRLAAPVLPKAFSQRVRAAEKSGFFGTRRENVVFSAVESWLNFGTINAGHSRRTPRNRTASSKPPQLEDKFYFKIFSSPAFSVLLEDGWKLRLFWKKLGTAIVEREGDPIGYSSFFLLPHSAFFPRMSQAGKKSPAAAKLSRDLGGEFLCSEREDSSAGYAHLSGVPRSKGMSDHASIAAFDDEESAKGLAVRMNEAGVEAFVNSDSVEQFLMFYTPHPRAEHHVLVPGHQLEAALQWLGRLDAADPVLSAAIRCPDCGSTRVEYPQFSRKTIVGSLPAIGAALGLIERQFYCTTCHFTWSPDKAPAASGSP